MSEKQLRERIYKLEDELRILREILGHKREGFGRPKGSIKYTPEQIGFLKECEKQKLSDKEIVRQFNSEFGTNLNIDSRALYNFMVREGIKIIKNDR